MVNQPNAPADKYTYTTVDAARKAYTKSERITKEVLAVTQRELWNNVGDGRAITWDSLENGGPKVRSLIYKSVRKGAIEAFEAKVGKLQGDMSLFAPAILSSFGISEAAMDRIIPEDGPIGYDEISRFFGNTAYTATEIAKSNVMDSMTDSAMEETVKSWVSENPNYTVADNFSNQPKPKRTALVREVLDKGKDLEAMLKASPLIKKAPQR